jgi:RecQ mediated genome instability protein
LNKYGFDIAIELLVESLQNEILQLNFLVATTCFETLMHHYHKINNTEYVLDDEEFKIIYNELKKKSKEVLKQMDKCEDIRKSVYESLQEIKRRHYSEKAKKLLVKWNVHYADIEITIDEIVKTRNNIVHAGGDNLTDEESFAYLMRVWKGLMTILIRIFLSMLNYKRNYQDWFLGREVFLDRLM